MRTLSRLVMLLGGAFVIVMLLGEAFSVVVVCLFDVMLAAGVLWPLAALVFKLGRMTARLNPWTPGCEREGEVPGMGSTSCLVPEGRHASTP